MVDVGSNSVRMVVFEGGRRCPAVVFNEKVLCGLGAELSQTGRLAPDGVERAIRELKRFVLLASGLRVGSMAGVATAAVREAEDGAAFAKRVTKETNIRLDIASGADEARLAAQGVLFGDPDARGLVVDLGGASMELCPVRAGKPGKGVTTPLGPQRLGDISNPDKARKAIAKALAPHQARYKSAVKRLYLVGGAWRALGRVQLIRTDHPLPILHEFQFDADAARRLTWHVLSCTPDELAATPGVSSARVATLPYAALLLDALLDQFEPEDVVISGFGLREGVCFEYLAQDVRGEDPLLSTCKGQEYTRSRAPGFGKELARWLMAAIEPLDAREKRLIRATCSMVDVSWRAHPEYRANACIEVVSRVNVSGVGHVGRAFMAAILLCRYKGGRKALAAEPAIKLLSEEQLQRAVTLGALMRLGATIAGATPGYLAYCPLRLFDGVLSLKPSRRARAVIGEEVEKRLSQAASTMNADWAIES